MFSMRLGFGEAQPTVRSLRAVCANGRGFLVSPVTRRIALRFPAVRLAVRIYLVARRAAVVRCVSRVTPHGRDGFAGEGLPVTSAEG